MISARAAKALGLTTHGARSCSGAFGKAVKAPLHRVSARFMDYPAAPLLDILEASAFESDVWQGIVLIIGRDVLSSLRMTYDGPSGMIHLFFPRPASGVS
jgi:hypothetical protein